MRGPAGLRIREWTCDDCGAVHDRDHNAAKNILARGVLRAVVTIAGGPLDVCQPDKHEMGIKSYRVSSANDRGYFR